MKLEDQVISLELAKKLKELGVKKKSLFHWYEGNLSTAVCFGSIPDPGLPNNMYAAFTVAELCEILPEDVAFKEGTFSYNLEIIKFRDWNAGYFTEDGYRLHMEEGKHLGNTCAQVLIYLIENKLIEMKND